MYSPKISEDLIPVLYRIKKNEGIPMTKIVDKFIRESISKYIAGTENHDRMELGFTGEHYWKNEDI
jgi:hypothetical protein